MAMSSGRFAKRLFECAGDFAKTNVTDCHDLVCSGYWTSSRPGGCGRDRSVVDWRKETRTWCHWREATDWWPLIVLHYIKTFEAKGEYHASLSRTQLRVGIRNGLVHAVFGVRRVSIAVLFFPFLPREAMLARYMPQTWTWVQISQPNPTDYVADIDPTQPIPPGLQQYHLEHRLLQCNQSWNSYHKF